MHVKILSEMEDVQIQAVCGTSKAKAEEFASAYSIPSSYESVSEMLDAERLDAVYILVPPMSHGEFEMQLIERGIPFFVEKPLGVNVEQPNQILTELRKKPLITSVGYHFRYTDTVSKMKQLLNQQNVGMITGNWMGNMPTGCMVERSREIRWTIHRTKHTSGRYSALLCRRDRRSLRFVWQSSDAQAI